MPESPTKETPPTPYPGHFVHGVDIGDWYPCWNLSLNGKFSSPDFSARFDPGLAAAHQAIRDTPIQILRTSGPPIGVLTSRATWNVWAAAWVRQGGRVGIGTQNTVWDSPETLDGYLRMGDIELAFEEVRRTILPDGASRLSSLYLADDSAEGRAHVRAMLGDHVQILRVTIPAAIRVTQADTEWFDRYCNDPKPEYITNYWSSVALNRRAPKWEYLVDGVIQVDDPVGLAHIRRVGAHNDLRNQRA